MRKLAESETAAVIMAELEQMFTEKYINKSLTRFSVLDGTNAMSGNQNGVQRKIQHVSPYALYINCRNHRFALCLIYLIKEYPELQTVDTLLLSIWKIFKYGSVKQILLRTPRLLKT